MGLFRTPVKAGKLGRGLAGGSDSFWTRTVDSGLPESGCGLSWRGVRSLAAGAAGWQVRGVSGGVCAAGWNQLWGCSMT